MVGGIRLTRYGWCMCARIHGFFTGGLGGLRSEVTRLNRSFDSTKLPVLGLPVLGLEGLVGVVPGCFGFSGMGTPQI